MLKNDIIEADVGPEMTGDELEPGTQLSNGNYTIVGHLKTGGFGITYLAKDTLGRPVVIKECFPSGMCSRASRAVRVRSRTHTTNVSTLIERFVVEAQSLAKINHPNIVKVHQIFKENETAYMSLDYVEGHDLLETMGHSSLALTPAGLRSTLLKLLDAIGVVHELGLLHRDISPDNILIDSKSNPILIDFGAARETDRGTESAASTLHVVKDGYSPQELYLAGGGDQGAWSDLYSLAATFYHVISGNAPPNSQDRLAAMAANVEDPCIPLAGRFEAYDAAFLAAIDKAMSVLPKGRMRSSRQWISAINESEGGKVLRMPPTEPTRRVTPMTRVTRLEAEASRKKIGPGAIIGGVVTVCLVVVGVYMAMPDSKTAVVARLPAELAAAAPAPAAPALVETVVAKPVPEAQAVAASPDVSETAVRSDITTLSSNWTIELPFAPAAGEPTTVATTTLDVPDWLVPGVQIFAVNGTTIASIDEITGILRQSVNPGVAPGVTATLSTIAEPGAAAVDQTIELSVVHRVLLASGAEFLVRWAGGSWKTEVATLPKNYGGEMRVGDIVVGHVSSNTRLDGPNSLKEVLEAEVIAGASSTKLAVQQDGQMWVVTFPLPK